MDGLAQKLFDAYGALGLPLECPFADVTRVYKRLAKRFHPDSNPDDPLPYQELMSRINTAYATIRECHAAGLTAGDLRDSHETGRRPGGGRFSDWYSRQSRPGDRDRTLWAWLEREDRAKRREEELRAKERERRERERAASDRFWEHVAQEKKREIRDRKTYDVIVKYAQKLISFYFKMNFGNSLFRARPYVRDNFVGYVDIYKQRLRRISALKRAHQSAAYKRRAGFAYAFLKSFISDTLKPHTAATERRSSALDVFERASRSSDRFISDFFSGDGLRGARARERFRESLEFYDTFLKAYPESPLVEHAYRKVDVLDKLYRGFIKEP
jgi:curved DNA-binding protein CbpA